MPISKEKKDIIKNRIKESILAEIKLRKENIDIAKAKLQEAIKIQEDALEELEVKLEGIDKL